VSTRDQPEGCVTHGGHQMGFKMLVTLACFAAASVQARVQKRKSKEAPAAKPACRFEPLTPEALAFFAKRGISRATLDRNKIQMATTFCPTQGTLLPAIAFPYYRSSELVNVKYRFMHKEFAQVRPR
jgi:hypothetical protein